MLSQIISEARSEEYRTRMKRLAYAETQRLVPKEPKQNIHIVYVIGHVNVCGGNKIILEHANGLKRLGTQISIISHFPKPDWFPIDVNYIKIPFQVNIAQFIPDCDVIVATYWDQINVCVDACIAPVVYFEQGDFHLFTDVSEELSITLNHLFALPAYITTVSERVSRIIESKYKRRPKVFHNALNRNVFYEKSSNSLEARKMIVVGSDRVEFKGIDELKQVHKNIVNRGYDLDFVWITPNEPLQPYGQVYINPPQTKIAELYRDAYVYVSGSHYESFSLPPLEAMACGTPVVVTDSNGVMEYAVNEHNSLVTNVRDIQGITDQVIRLLNDEELYRKLKKNGIDTANSFSWDTILSELLYFYKNVAAHGVQIQVNNEWDIICEDKDQLSNEELLCINHLLGTTKASEIWRPVEYSTVQGISNISWELFYKRRNYLEKGFPEKILIKSKNPNLTNTKYKTVAALFEHKKYVEVLRFLKDVLSVTSKESIEYPVCIRWITLCYIELEMYSNAFELLTSTLEIHKMNMELWYLLSRVLYGLGARDRAAAICEYFLTIDNSYFYPDYIGNLNELVSELCSKLNIENKESPLEASLLQTDNKGQGGLSRKYKVIIFGVNTLTEFAYLLTDPNKCTVEAIVDSSGQYAGTFIRNTKIIGLNEIKFLEYDYIVKLEANSLLSSLDASKIIDLVGALNNYYLYEYHKNINSITENQNDITGIVTGISYHEVGINTELLGENYKNMALSSQDLFYDYKIAEWILNYFNPNKTISNFIIGLSYYSFHFDLSLSIYKDRSRMYYPIFQTMHNYHEEKKAKQDYDQFETLSKKLLLDDITTKVFEAFKESKEKENTILRSRKMSNDDKLNATVLAEKDSNKNYPKTVEENKAILKQYLNMLQKNNITPVFVVCPVAKCYSDAFSPKLEREFHSIIREMKEEYDFKLLDYFRSRNFEEKDFYDASHLNINGRDKLSRMIDKELCR
ncbi:glycosyltransferase family 4 protein [Paenibacillus polymyxa]|uniref:glycosyltransferase family 4 protein n=1 Tax=Paenibacillus polymyxa TaxID=1406 RepID=UPI0007EAA511|nr:glycosyltransferase family 4 protein [Paenibacillus polymyxa]OAZ50929.1 hypothetical protein A9Z39_01185 [Paenibacillus polymyxa]